MRIRWFDRFVLVITSLLLLGLAVGVGLLAIGIGKESFLYWTDVLLYHTVNRVILCVVAVLLVIFALRLLFLRARKAAAPSSIFMMSTDAGSVRITLEAVETIIQRASRGNAQVREVRSKIMPEENQMRVVLRVMLTADANAKEVSTALQTTIKSALEDNTGIPVPDVQVIIEATPPAAPQRVE